MREHEPTKPLPNEPRRMMMSVYDKLRALGISLPAVAPSAAAFLPFVRTGNLIFVSGHIAKKDGKPWAGKLGADFTTAQGKEAAREVAVQLMGTLHEATGDLNKIARIIKLLVLVNSTSTFTEQHLVADGASEFFGEIFGDSGKHARSAFGVVQIPLGACVEIELIAESA
jgi:enamine deaminase RidA (YjgF/YER057c/UK114 family)